MKAYGCPVIRKTGLFGIIIILILSFCGTCCTAADSSPLHAKTQVLVYSVGSDLESGSAASSEELNDIVKYYKDTDPDSLDIVTAFGGSNKDGWRGMKIATIEQLKADANDGTFGNGQYLYSDTSADMGSVQSFAKFFSIARSYRTADKTILIISDHGASYDGIGVDEITSNSLQMNDIDTALRGAGISHDTIMFDACLMSSVEVGKTVQPYTRLMLGSEEIQRGGYDFEKFLGLLTASPDADSLPALKPVIDAYIDEDPGLRQVLTMSIIDVSKMSAIRESLDELGARLVPLCDDPQGLHDLKSAYNDAISLGISSGNTPTSVDLVSLLEHIRERRPELSTDIDTTIGLVRSAVVYERHNAFSKTVAGISIASPDAMDMEKYQQYGDGIQIAPHWDLFFQKMVAVSSGDGVETDTSAIGNTPMASAPGDDSAADRQNKEARSLPINKATLSVPGFIDQGNGSFALRDPYHTAGVHLEYYQINGSKARSIGSQPISPGASGLYQIPEWDGRWYYFTDFGTEKGTFWDEILVFFMGPKKPQPFLVDLEYDGVTAGGFAGYYSWISVRDGGQNTNATLAMFVNRSTNTAETVIIPYTVTAEGKNLFGEGMVRFKPGSLVTGYSYGFDVRTDIPDEYILATRKAGPDTHPEYAVLPDGTYAAGIVAYYDNDDEVHTSQFRIITTRNGAVISSVVGPLG
ncbi:MAG: clostripain-related cysteine peptidase [Methanomicrobiales archaeon]